MKGPEQRRGEELAGICPQDQPLPSCPDMAADNVPAGDDVPEGDDALEGLSATAAEAYWEARLRGLCHEGALEVARGRR